MAAYTTIDDPSAFFKVQLWTGDGNTPRTITFDDTDTDMAPDLIWIKLRTTNHAHKLYDTVRGVNERHLVPDEDSAETTGQPSDGYMTATTSDGFTVAKGSSTWWNHNKASETYVAWCWKAGTTSGITTNGSTDITPSAYSFNQTAGFSIIQYTGNDTANQQIAHGLGVAPHQIIVKSSSNSANWAVYNIGVNGGSSPEDYALELNTTDAQEDESGFWNDTVPDTVNFTVDRDGRTNN